MLRFLREAQIIPLVEHAAPDSGAESVVLAYRRYLAGERRLTAASVATRVWVARQFLSTLAIDGDLQLDRLTPADVTGFVLRQSHRYRPGSMKVLTVARRCLLRFLFMTGAVERDLSEAVPAVADRQRTELPRDVDADTVVALLEGCDRCTPVGMRDYAIVTLLVRLGLRAGEVAGLQLADVDWRAGELVIRGKGNRIDRMPLPHDVGTALAAYLRHGRRRSACRALFLRACGPDGPMSSRSVTMVPRTASARAGVPVVGAHTLRHYAATAMLRAGAPLAEIGQALRHRAEVTTSRYAAVDRAQLDTVAQPWPGGTR